MASFRVRPLTLLSVHLKLVLQKNLFLRKTAALDSFQHILSDRILYLEIRKVTEHWKRQDKVVRSL